MAAEDYMDLQSQPAEKLQALGELEVRSYWQRVTNTLERVFGKTPDEAKRAIESLRNRLEEQASAETRLYFYHLEPLQVAADIAGEGHRPLLPTEKAAYVDLLDTYPGERPNSAALSRPLPDDLMR